MDEKLSINIKIDGRNYPLKINRIEEERYRKAAKIVNEVLIQYKKKYANNDSRDFLAMTAFQFVLKNIELQEKADVSPIIKEIEIFNEQLENYFDE